MPSPLARRKLLAAGLATLALLLLYAAWIEPRWVVSTRHVIGRERPGDLPMRVVQLSDLHVRELGLRERRAAALTRAERPELIVLTGDMIGDPRDLPALDAFLSLLGDGSPVLAVPGNWEHWANVPFAALREVLARHRGTLLVDQLATGVHGGRPWAVIGLDDPPGPPSLGDRAALEATVNRLVLAHEPTARDGWRGPPAVALLSGHTHGGQLAIGRLAPLIPPGSGGGYVSGWYRGPPVDLYVSRGIGTSSLPLRFGARPEVAIFDWWLE